MVPFDPSRPLTVQESIDREPRFKEEIKNNSKVKKLLYRPIIIDFRNIYNPDELFKQGMEYYSVGRPQ